MKRALLLIIVAALYVLHQDFWFWRAAHPLVFGFLPIGLFYHACYTIATSFVIWLLVKYAWPSHLEQADGSTGRQGDGAPPLPVSQSPRLPVASSLGDTEQ